MEIIKGVHLHFIQSEKFKTNKIKVRFSAPMSEKTIAGRVLTASMLETSNALYPTSQAFREKLANLYGANYSTSLSRRGLVHYLDINLSFVRDQFLSRKNMLADEILDFLKASLFFPLSNGQAFDTKTFEIEKRNVLTDLEAEIENLKSGIKSRNDRLSNVIAEKQNINEGHLLPDISKLQEERNALDDAFILISKNKEEVAAKLSKATKEITSIRESIEKLQSQKVLEEIKLAKNQTQVENLTQRLWDEFEMSIAQATDMKDPDFLMSTGIKIGRETRKRLRELGDVNIGAIKEYEEVSKRYEFLKEQREDILDAMNELKSIISDMSTTIKTKFKDSFNHIVTNFEDIFVELFGGGYAELTLENEDDPLNSGIEIVAQPPGKKLQNINLMSGGEKTMTAIALMFAVLKAKPTPFCILDEVEAALDDSNIDRFSQYLKKFENIQFVLVTHQKATMEHADVLYGVTMAEQGVSNLLSLKLGDHFEI